MKDLSNDVEYMKEYLRQALKMESHVYVWEEALEEVKGKRDQNETLQLSLKNTQQKAEKSLGSIDAVYEKKKEAAKESINAINRNRFIFLALCPFFVLAGIIILSISDEPTYISCFFGAVGCLVAFFIFSKRVHDSNSNNNDAVLNNEKNSMVNSLTATKAQAEYNLDLANKKELRLVSDQQKIYSELKKARQSLTDIYSNNALPVKYRNFASVATLYGYLENRRCTTIAGHGGIYDTYEYDQQLGAINDNLNEIKYAVYQIYEAQYYLYDELTKANNHLNDIKRELGTINYNSERAANNSAIGAEASRQSADMLNWWNWTRKY